MNRRRSPLRSRSFRALGPGLGLAFALALGGPAAAQAGQIDAGYADTTDGTGIQFVPATPFQWSTAATNVGPVHIPVGVGGGWIITPQGQWRLIPSMTPDPTFEVMLFPPYSGNVESAERFLLQVPVGPTGAFVKAKGLVIGFHASNLTEANVFQGTDLPDICYQRKWILVSPYGLSQVNFANVNSQDALDAVLAAIDLAFDFDTSRIYTVGFSMGGMNAVSWAMRHLDPDGYRVAGVVNHTGTMDAALTYTTGSGPLKVLMANAIHFNGTPTTDPFSYDRVSPIRMLGLAADPDKAPVTNLAAHVPFYLHYNVLDPNPNLLEQTQALITYLQSLGANVKVTTSSVENTHWWATMDMYAAMDWIGRFSLPADPDAFQIFADGKEAYLSTKVRDVAPATIARYSFARGTGNDFDLYDTSDLGELVLDLAGLGLDPTQTLTFDADAMDGSPDVIVLAGYATSPSDVQENGQPASWSYSPAREELVITASTSPAAFVVTP